MDLRLLFTLVLAARPRERRAMPTAALKLLPERGVSGADRPDDPSQSMIS
jgi:hypothetical protein